MGIRRSVLILILVLIGLAISPARVRAASKWIELRSANFLLQGDVNEKELREVARRLEEFREVLSRGLPNANISTPAPTVVLVFGSNKAYDPFRPLYQGKPRSNIAGYFVTGRDRNYLTMVVGDRSDPYPIAYHELTHLVVDATLRRAPLWLNEGLAEFYRTFTLMDDGKQAQVGAPINYHLFRLRSTFLPLADLLSAGYDSPLYIGPKSDVFYAESWAFVHYLAFEQKAQFSRLVDGLGAGLASDRAIDEAFGVPVATLEKQLRNYIFRFPGMSRRVPLSEPVAQRINDPAKPIRAADIEARLGDLLVHMGRLDEGEARLQAALKLDATNPRALIALGETCARRGKPEEALVHTRAAAAANPEDFDAQLALGTLLVQRTFLPGRDALDEGRKAFEAALKLHPDSADASAGVAMTLLLSKERLDEAQRLAERAVALAPSEPNHALLLARVLVTRGNLTAARQQAGPLTISPRPEVRQQAQAVISAIASLERRAESNSATGRPPDPGEAVVSPAADGTLFLTRKPRDGEQRVFGSLVRIECSPRETIFHVKAGDRTIRVTSTKPESISVTFRKDLRQIDCGPREPPDPVFVTFQPAAKTVKPATSATPAPDGEAVALEFMPSGYVPKDPK